jgi:superfamily II DNA or RNA helicase
MVSEGVDIPRLRVGVYATPARTELFFRQVVGRFVRRTPQPRRQMSYLLMPADPDLKLLAAQVEEERRHALELDEALEERDQPVERAEAGDGFTALSSNAHLEDVISSTTAPGDALLLFADEDSPQMSTAAPVSSTPAEPEEVVAEPQEEAAFQKRRRLRDERAALVSKLARRGGSDHRSVNAWVNRAVGVTSVADATADQLQRSITVLETELRR